MQRKKQNKSKGVAGFHHCAHANKTQTFYNVNNIWRSRSAETQHCRACTKLQEKRTFLIFLSDLCGFSAKLCVTKCLHLRLILGGKIMFIYITAAIIVVGGVVGYLWYQRSGKATEDKAHHQEAGLKALKMRYMNGEITKEEYDELVAARKG